MFLVQMANCILDVTALLCRKARTALLNNVDCILYLNELQFLAPGGVGLLFFSFAGIHLEEVFFFLDALCPRADCFLSAELILFTMCTASCVCPSVINVRSELHLVSCIFYLKFLWKMWTASVSIVYRWTSASLQVSFNYFGRACHFGFCWWAGYDSL